LACASPYLRSRHVVGENGFKIQDPQAISMKTTYDLSVLRC